jgi:hypothetical protein
MSLKRHGARADENRPGEFIDNAVRESAKRTAV